MTPTPVPPPPPAGGAGPPLEVRLERGEVVYYPACPFALPSGDDHRFLLGQRLAGRAHKNVSYNPHTGKANGFGHDSPEQAERVRAILAAFSQSVTSWAARVLPCYAAAWRLDRVSYRPEEEATRTLRQKA